MKIGCHYCRRKPAAGGRGSAAISRYIHHDSQRRSTNRSRQYGMAAPVPLRGSRILVPRAWTLGGSEPMNIFATDHPLNSQSGINKPRLRSHSLRICLAAVSVCPFLAVYFWSGDVADSGNSTEGYTPAPFWVDCLAAAVVSLLVAFVGASALMLLATLFRKFSKKRLTYAA
jgi:hypothetical protein